MNLSESVSLTDSISKTVGVNLSESVSLADETSMAAGVNLSESISLADETSRGRWCEPIRVCIVGRLDMQRPLV